MDITIGDQRSALREVRAARQQAVQAYQQPPPPRRPDEVRISDQAQARLAADPVTPVAVPADQVTGYDAKGGKSGSC